jgi:hypothetical protein
MIAPRCRIVAAAARLVPSPIEVPAMNRKNGKMRSVGVQPSHSAGAGPIHESSRRDC